MRRFISANRPRIVRAALVALLGLAIVPAAQAACGDVPAPGVEWRRCQVDNADLQHASLAGSILRDTSFKRSDLSHADLAGADLQRSKFISAILVGTNLDRANLSNTDLTNANLSGASLRQSNLRGARLFNANLTGANLTEANLTGVDMPHADLSGATWIDGKTICAAGSIGRCTPSAEPTSAPPGAS